MKSTGFARLFQKKLIKLSFFLILTLFLTVSLVRNIRFISTSNQKIQIAQEKLDEVSEKNSELQQMLQDIENPAYQEKQLRDKLGFAKEGEIVLVLPKEDIVRKFAPTLEIEEEMLPDPNWKKWVNLFM